MNKIHHKFHIRRLICGHVLAAAVFCALILSNRASAQEDIPVPVCSDRQFDLEVAAILDTYDEPVTKAQAAREPFLSSRLILKSDDITVDPYLLGAADAVQDMDGHYIIQFNSPEEAEQAARSLEQDPGTIYVEPDRYLFTSDEGGDTGGDSSDSCWGTEFIGAADYVQYLNEGGAASADPIRIAVVDSGVRKTHELLSGLIDSQYEKDFVDNDDDASDSYSHGTFVAGIIAQCVKDLGNIRIIPVRVMSGKGVETTAFVRGIRHIAGKVNYTNGTSGYRKRADVMNLSIVSTAASTSQYLTEYIANAARSGCTVVIAAGNSGGDASNYPPANITDAQSPGTIIVSSCSRSGEPVVNFAASPGSNYGETVDISAPGIDLRSCDLTSDTAYRSGSGTSYSAPYVSAAAALVMAAYPSATPAQIESVLTESAAQLNNSTGRWYGSGILNLRALIPGNGEDTQVDQEAAQAVTDLIDALPSVITLDDRPDVEAARSAYNGLTAKQKLLVTNLALLEGAEKKIRDLDAAGAVMALIDQIPDPVTVEDAEAIENARAAYDALTDDQKALVDHYDRLTESEAALQTALEEKAQADQAAADEVNALISGLPEPVTPEDEEAVTEARAAYNALTDDQKLLVTDYSVLEQAEKTIADYKAAGAVAALIALIPDPVTKDDADAVSDARAAYDALTGDQKALVTNYAHLVEAETALEKPEETETDPPGPSYASSDPKPNVDYRVPLRRRQKIALLRVDGLADGDHIVSWKSSDKKKAKVSGQEDGTCVIRAGKKTGKVRITATAASGRKVIFRLRIQKNRVRTKKLKAERLKYTLSAGDTQQISVVRNPVSSREKITYQSQNRDVASVSKNGLIRAVSPGNAVILVTSGNAKRKIAVTVTG